jgi:integrase
VNESGTDLAATTCRLIRATLGLDADANTNRRLEALFVLAITLGLRPGELRKFAWDHVDLDNEVIHVWRSASETGEVKTPKSKRSLMLPQHAAHRTPGAQEAPGGRTASRGCGLAGQQPRDRDHVPARDRSAGAFYSSPENRAHAD